MLAPKVTEEVTFSTIETCKKSTTTNKRILRNTWRGNAVQVNSYDSEGRLQNVETDKETFQDLDTEYYTWTDKDAPPNIPPPDYDSKVEPFGANSLKTTTQMASNGSVLVLKSTEISSTPIVHWTGENTQQLTSESTSQSTADQPGSRTAFHKSIANVPHSGPQIPPHLYSGDPPQHGDMVVAHTVKEGPATRETDYKLRETMDGSKWSRTEETVWMSSNKPRVNPNLAIMYDHQDGIKAAIQNGVAENGGMTIEERRKMRRSAARAMTANNGRDY